MKQGKVQTFYDWVYNPNCDDEIISNSFRRVVRYAFDNNLQIDTMDIFAPDPYSLEWKIATLLYHKRITPEGTKIYVYRDGNLSPLPEGMEDLQHLLHESEKNTAKIYGLLQHELNGVVRGLVESDTIGIIEERDADLLGKKETVKYRINLKTMTRLEGEASTLIPELGWHESSDDRVWLLWQFFAEQNSAFDCSEEFFFEKAISYPFHQRIREKAFICNGPGGVGKTLMTKVAAKLYGSKGQVGSEPTFTGQDRNRITREFIGKKFVIYNDLESPSTQLMTWLKPMLTDNMTIKGEGGYERSVPCEAVFYLETNFKPQFLGGNQDIRRFTVRSAKPDYKLIDHMDSEDLDVIEHECTAGDVAVYLYNVRDLVEASKGWCHFEEKPLPVADFIEIAQEFFAEYPAKITKGVITAYANQNKLSKVELETLKEVLLSEAKHVEEKKGSSESAEELLQEGNVSDSQTSGQSSDEDVTTGQDSSPVLLPSVQALASNEPEGREEGMNERRLENQVLGSMQALLPRDGSEEASSAQDEEAAIQEMSEPSSANSTATINEYDLSDF